MLLPGFNLDGVQTTTGNVAPMIIVNGPCRHRLKINSGANVLGQGWRANATIGRALRLIMANIGGATPGNSTSRRSGSRAKYTFCFGENEEASPWQPLHVERSVGKGVDTVSVTGCSGVYSAVDMASQTGQRTAQDLRADDDRRFGERRTTTEVLFVICPEHAAIFRRRRILKDAIRQELFAMARLPHEKISDENLELLSEAAAALVSKKWRSS